MTISETVWSRYIAALRKVNDTAADKVLKYMQTHDIYVDRQAFLDYCYGIATQYGEGAAALSCQMYDALAELSGETLIAAEPAATATWNEVAKAVQGTMKTGNAETIAGSVGRLVKMAGVDTTQKNAIRDGAEWAWIPQGETCAFCITLASRGWQRASRKALKGGHAEHIHANCDCTYAIRFSRDTNVAGYDPDRYLDMYNATRGTPEEKINAMRRAFYAENKAGGLLDLDSSIAEEIDI